MGLYPHSGNKCSGLCNDSPPCPHEDCWQCLDMKSQQAVKRLEASTKKLQKEQAKANGGLLGKTQNSANRPRGRVPAPNLGPQMVPVERTVLESLATKAGVYINWMPNGDPVFVDTLTGVGSAFGRSLYGQVATAQAAKALANATDKYMDNIARDMIKDHYMQWEKDAEEKLKAKGADDNDIDAAKRLLGSRTIAPEKTQLAITLERMKEAAFLKHWSNPTKSIGRYIAPADLSSDVDKK